MPDAATIHFYKPCMTQFGLIWDNHIRSCEKERQQQLHFKVTKMIIQLNMNEQYFLVFNFGHIFQYISASIRDKHKIQKDLKISHVVSYDNPLFKNIWQIWIFYWST